MVKDVVRRLHHEQDSLAKQGSDDSQHDGNDEGNPKTVGYVTPQVAVLTCTERLSHGNAETATAAGAESDDEEYDRCAGTHGCQIVDA